MSSPSWFRRRFRPARKLSAEHSSVTSEFATEADSPVRDRDSAPSSSRRHAADDDRQCIIAGALLTRDDWLRVWLHVAMWLPLRDLAALSQTCRLLSALLDDDRLWLPRYLQAFWPVSHPVTLHQPHSFSSSSSVSSTSSSLLPNLSSSCPLFVSIPSTSQSSNNQLSTCQSSCQSSTNQLPTSQLSTSQSSNNQTVSQPPSPSQSSSLSSSFESTSSSSQTDVSLAMPDSPASESLSSPVLSALSVSATSRLSPGRSYSLSLALGSDEPAAAEVEALPLLSRHELDDSLAQLDDPRQLHVERRPVRPQQAIFQSPVAEGDWLRGEQCSWKDEYRRELTRQRRTVRSRFDYVVHQVVNHKRQVSIGKRAKSKLQREGRDFPTIALPWRNYLIAATNCGHLQRWSFAAGSVDALSSGSFSSSPPLAQSSLSGSALATVRTQLPRRHLGRDLQQDVQAGTVSRRISNEHIWWLAIAAGTSSCFCAGADGRLVLVDLADFEQSAASVLFASSEPIWVVSTDAASRSVVFGTQSGRVYLLSMQPDWTQLSRPATLVFRGFDGVWDVNFLTPSLLCCTSVCVKSGTPAREGPTLIDLCRRRADVAAMNNGGHSESVKKFEVLPDASLVILGSDRLLSAHRIDNGVQLPALLWSLATPALVFDISVDRNVLACVCTSVYWGTTVRFWKLTAEAVAGQSPPVFIGDAFIGDVGRVFAARMIDGHVYICAHLAFVVLALSFDSDSGDELTQSNGLLACNAVGETLVLKGQLSDPFDHVQLFHALSLNSSLRLLDLSSNRLDDDKSALLLRALTGHRSLRALELSSAQLGNAGAAQLARLLTHDAAPPLEDLWLNDNQIGAEGARQLAQALDGNTQLRSLSLASNPLGVAGAQELLRSLRDCNTSLTQLNVRATRLNGDVCAAVAQTLRVNTTLTSLVLARNKIGTQAFEPVLQALEVHNTTLRELNTKWLQLSDACTARLKSQLIRNRSAPCPLPDQPTADGRLDLRKCGLNSSLAPFPQLPFDSNPAWRQAVTIDLRGNPHLRHIPASLGCFHPLSPERCRLRDVLFDEENMPDFYRLIIRNGAAAIVEFAHFCQTGGPNVTIPSLRVMICGDPAVGKSSLVRLLRGEGFCRTMVSTDGVDISTFDYPAPSHLLFNQTAAAATTMVSFRLFDFGGQSLYRYTHSMFLSNDAVYLLVVRLTAAAVHNRESILSWLQTIADRAPAARILVIGTHADRLAAGELSQAEQPIIRLLHRYCQQTGRSHAIPVVSLSSAERGNLTPLFTAIVQLGRDFMPTAPKVVDVARHRLQLLVHSRQASSEPPVLTLPQLCDWLDTDQQRGTIVDQLVRVLELLGLIYVVRPLTAERRFEPLAIFKVEYLAQLFASVVTTRHALVRSGFITDDQLRSAWAGSQFPAQYREQLLAVLERCDVLFPIAAGRYLVPAALPTTAPAGFLVARYWQPAGRLLVRRVFRCHLRRSGIGRTPRDLFARVLVNLLGGVVLQHARLRPSVRCIWEQGCLLYEPTMRFKLLCVADRQSLSFCLSRKMPRRAVGSALLAIANTDTDAWTSPLRCSSESRSSDGSSSSSSSDATMSYTQLSAVYRCVALWVSLFSLATRAILDNYYAQLPFAELLPCVAPSCIVEFAVSELQAALSRGSRVVHCPRRHSVCLAQAAPDLTFGVRDTDFLLDADQLSFGREIGRGAFGRVLDGRLSVRGSAAPPCRVALKLLDLRSSYASALHDFFAAVAGRELPLFLERARLAVLAVQLFARPAVFVQPHSACDVDSVLAAFHATFNGVAQLALFAGDGAPLFAVSTAALPDDSDRHDTLPFCKDDWLPLLADSVQLRLVASSRHSSVQFPVDEFFSEARLQSMLGHPNIVALLGVCLSPGADPVLVMEFAPFGALSALLYDLFSVQSLFDQLFDVVNRSASLLSNLLRSSYAPRLLRRSPQCPPHWPRLAAVYRVWHHSLQRAPTLSPSARQLASEQLHHAFHSYLHSLQNIYPLLSFPLLPLSPQSIHQSIHQSIDQSVDQSVDQSIHQSVDQSIHQSVDQSVHQSIDRLGKQSTRIDEQAMIMIGAPASVEAGALPSQVEVDYRQCKQRLLELGQLAGEHTELIAPLDVHTVCLKIACEIALGMEYLHSFVPPILHCDLKSPNVLLAQSLLAEHAEQLDVAQPICKIADLGLAVQQFCRSRDAVADVNPTWAAPELLDGEPCSTKSDVYAYGMLMYELVTRRLPFLSECTSLASVAAHVRQGGRPTLPADVDAHWRALIESCWHADPSQRPTFTQIYAGLAAVAGRVSPALLACLPGGDGQPAASGDEQGQQNEPAADSDAEEQPLRRAVAVKTSCAIEAMAVTAERDIAWLCYTNGAVAVADLRQATTRQLVVGCSPRDVLPSAGRLMHAQHSDCWIASDGLLSVWRAVAGARSLVESTHLQAWLAVSVQQHKRFQLLQPAARQLWVELEDGRVAMYRDEIQGAPEHQFLLADVASLSYAPPVDDDMSLLVGDVKYRLKSGEPATLQQWCRAIERVMTAIQCSFTDSSSSSSNNDDDDTDSAASTSKSKQLQVPYCLALAETRSAVLSFVACPSSGRLFTLLKDSSVVEWTLSSVADLTGLWRQDQQQLLPRLQLQLQPLFGKEPAVAAVTLGGDVWWVALRNSAIHVVDAREAVPVVAGQLTGHSHAYRVRSLAVLSANTVVSCDATSVVLWRWRQRGLEAACQAVIATGQRTVFATPCLLGGQLFVPVVDDVLVWSVPMQRFEPALSLADAARLRVIDISASGRQRLLTYRDDTFHIWVH